MGSYEIATSLGLLRPKLSPLVVLLVLFSFSAVLASVGCGNDDQDGSQGGGQGGSGFSDDTIRRVDGAIAERMREDNLPGVVVGVWVPGEGEYVVAKGKANLKTGEKRDLDDPFRIGSITKTFVATAILQLVEDGKLSKSDKLAKWYPEFPDAEKITIEHLLRMQSGIVGPEGEPQQYRTTEELIEASAKQGILFGTPGQRTEYSDINYILLGEIIRKISGNDTGDQIERSILKPLGMKDTVYPTNNDLPGDFCIPVRSARGLLGCLRGFFDDLFHILYFRLVGACGKRIPKHEPDLMLRRLDGDAGRYYHEWCIVVAFAAVSGSKPDAWILTHRHVNAGEGDC